jgi:hypothetical protein
MPQTLSNELPDFYNILEYGDSGSGKTRSLATLAKACRELYGEAAKIYIFSFDPNRLATIKGVPGIEWDDYSLFSADSTMANLKPGDKLSDKLVTDLLDRAVKLYSAVWANVQELKKSCLYKAVAFDSITYFMEIVRYYIMKLSGRGAISYGKPVVKGQDPAFSMSDFGTHGDLTSDVLAMLLSLPCHKVVTSHSRIVQNEDTGSMMYLPAAFGQKFPQELPRMFNEVYRMVVKPKLNAAPEYKFQTRNDAQWPAKTSLNAYNVKTGNLEPILDMWEEPDFSVIFKKVEAKRKELSASSRILN